MMNNSIACCLKLSGKFHSYLAKMYPFTFVSLCIFKLKTSYKSMLVLFIMGDIISARLQVKEVLQEDFFNAMKYSGFFSVYSILPLQHTKLINVLFFPLKLLPTGEWKWLICICQEVTSKQTNKQMPEPLLQMKQYHFSHCTCTIYSYSYGYILPMEFYQSWPTV